MKIIIMKMIKEVDENRISRKTKIVGVIVIIVGMILFCLLNEQPVISYDKSEVIKKADMYKAIGRYYIEDYKKYKSDELLVYLSPSNKNNLKYSRCVTSQYEHDLTLTDEIYNYYREIEHDITLDHHNVCGISVKDSFAYFEIENGRASIIYSKDGKKPEYVNGGSPPDIKKNNYIEKITDNLYYGCWQN